MDRKTQNLIYNVGKSILQEEKNGVFGFDTSGIGAQLKFNPASLPPKEYIEYAKSHGLTTTADPNDPETKLMRIHGELLAQADGTDKYDTAETWGPGDKTTVLGKTGPSTPAAPATDAGAPDSDPGMFSRAGEWFSGLPNRTGEWWGGLSNPEKAGVIGLAGAPLALGASYLAYKKLRNKK